MPRKSQKGGASGCRRTPQRAGGSCHKKPSQKGGASGCRRTPQRAGG